MEKLNIAEILKDCPKGMKLYTTIWGEVEFIKVNDLSLITILPTSNLHNTNDTRLLYSNGRFTLEGECVIFPSKENRDWSNFHKPFENGDKIHLWTIQDAKNGDVISCDDGWTCIFKRIHGIWFSSHCFITSDGEFHTSYEEHAVDSTINGNAHLATNEQCNLLFRKIKEAGYKWNPETKTLEDLLKPKFKVGDKIQNRIVKTNNVYTIVGIKGLKYFVNMNNEKHNYEIDFEVQDDWELVPVVPKFKVGDKIKYKDSELYCTLGEYSKDISAYRTNIGLSLTYKDLEQWELVPNKFDITTLKPFDKVLVRQSDTDYWKPAFWGRCIKSKSYPFITSFGHTTQAVPFKNNEWLVGTTEDCDNYYKTWYEN